MSDNTNDHLPPGFRFCPTDEELIVHFLQRKVSLIPYDPHIIPDLDLYPYDPWDLEGKAMMEGKKWYYYSRRTENRITTSGYWKSWGFDEQIRRSSNRNQIVGVKTYHVFHTGEAPEGVRTHWMMEEFKLANGDSSSGSSSTRKSKRKGQSKLDFSNWVICRVFEDSCDNDNNDGKELSSLDEVFLSLDDFDDITSPS